MHKKALPFIALAAISFSIQAEWRKYGTNNDGDVAYMDLATIRTTPNGYRVWEISDYITSQKSGELSEKSLMEYDCREERYRTLQATHYSGHMGEGNIKGRLNVPNEWRYASPGSISESALRRVCAKNR